MNLIPVRLEDLRQRAQQRAHGYLEDVFEQAAVIAGEEAFFELQTFQELISRYRPLEAQEPTIGQLAVNFTGAVRRWASAGFPIVEKTEYERRASICNVCAYWDGKARLGIGSCRAPGCGCTGLKRWLHTENCPLEKWKKY